MKKLLALVVLLIPWSLLSSCMLPPAREAHSDWSAEVLDAVERGQIAKGMTWDQAECGLGRAAFGGHHHLRPSSWSDTSTGFSMGTYTLEKYWKSHGGNYAVLYFDSHGRLYNWSFHQLSSN